MDDFYTDEVKGLLSSKLCICICIWKYYWFIWSHWFLLIGFSVRIHPLYCLCFEGLGGELEQIHPYRGLMHRDKMSDKSLQLIQPWSASVLEVDTVRKSTQRWDSNQEPCCEATALPLSVGMVGNIHSIQQLVHRSKSHGFKLEAHSCTGLFTSDNKE